MSGSGSRYNDLLDRRDWIVKNERKGSSVIGDEIAFSRSIPSACLDYFSPASIASSTVSGDLTRNCRTSLIVLQVFSFGSTMVKRLPIEIRGVLRR